MSYAIGGPDIVFTRGPDYGTYVNQGLNPSTAAGSVNTVYWKSSAGQYIYSVYIPSLDADQWTAGPTLNSADSSVYKYYVDLSILSGAQHTPLGQWVAVSGHDPLASVTNAKQAFVTGASLSLYNGMYGYGGLDTRGLTKWAKSNASGDAYLFADIDLDYVLSTLGQTGAAASNADYSNIDLSRTTQKSANEGEWTSSGTGSATDIVVRFVPYGITGASAVGNVIPAGTAQTVTAMGFYERPNGGWDGGGAGGRGDRLYAGSTWVVDSADYLVQGVYPANSDVNMDDPTGDANGWNVAASGSPFSITVPASARVAAGYVAYRQVSGSVNTYQYAVFDVVSGVAEPRRRAASSLIY